MISESCIGVDGASYTEVRPVDRADDRGTGLMLFVIFTAACLIATSAVAMLALIDTWWVLGLAFGIHLIMTAAVGLAVFRALSARAVTLANPEARPIRETHRVPPQAGRDAVAAHL